MRQPTKLTIGKNNYVVGNWDVDKALETLVWLTKTFGEGFMTIFVTDEGQDAMGKIMSSEKSDESEKKLVSEFAAKVVDRLDAKEYVKYSRLIVSGTRCNGEEILFNTHFIGKMGELHRLMFNILRHQYSDFFGEGEGEG